MTRVKLTAMTAGLALLVCSSPPALAISPPEANPAALPPDGRPGALEPMAQRQACAAPAPTPTDVRALSANQAMLNLGEAWRFSRGDHVEVAVVDTGVQPSPRLPDVASGGDYVEGGDGLTDCDAHGTLVAGLIAGQPDPSDGFAGVAPAAKLISVRAVSAMWAPRTPNEDGNLRKTVSDMSSLARAIVHSANLGAEVIVVPTAICLPATRLLGQAARGLAAAQDQLGAALRYAAIDKDAVVVAAAGDIGASACSNNPLAGAERPDDPRGWGQVSSVSLPSFWQPYVLSAASLTTQGQPSAFTMAGPWVSVAAPGENIVSLGNDPAGRLVDALPWREGESKPINSTAYAAAYAAGVAALVRARYPQLTAHQVLNRMLQTAHNPARVPSNLTGSGVLDPVAALTWDVPAGEPRPVKAPVRQIDAPLPAAPDNRTPRRVAFAGAGALALLVLVATGIAATRRNR